MNAIVTNDLTVELPTDEPLIVMTRMFDAPPELVWKVWTSAEHVAIWWGVAGSVNKVVTYDVRPGGAWRIESGEGDQKFTFKGTYLEVHPTHRLVNTFGMEGMYEDKMLVEAHTFEGVNGKTKYTSTMRMDSFEDRQGMVDSGMQEGARQSMDRIEALLKVLQGDDK
jgi:uncharacterized protein YndB with AHSA1/START domain